MENKLVYGIHDKPKFGSMLVFAFQQVLAILAATILVPAIIGNGMSQSAALFGAGVGTLVYQLFTKFRSPVFLGSSFAFIGSMLAAFGGAASASAGYAGLIVGAVFAGLVYVVIAIIVKFAGVAWINKLMPTVVIGPTVALIGLSLAVNAVNDLTVGIGQLHGQLCQFADREFLRHTQVDRTGHFMRRSHHTHQAFQKVIAVAETAGLTAVAVQSYIFILQSLQDKITDYAAVARVHIGSISIENTHDLDRQIALHTVTVEKRFRAAFAFIVA